MTKKNLEVIYEQPIVHMKMRGVSTAKEMVAFLEQIKTDTAEWPYQVTLCDLSEQESGTDAETRKAIASMPAGKSPQRGAAMYGASFAIRTVATLLINVMDLTQDRKDAPSKFFATEAEARAWLKDRIAQIESRSAA